MRFRLGWVGVAVAVTAALGVLWSSATGATSGSNSARAVTSSNHSKQPPLPVHNFAGKDAVGVFRNLTPYPLTFVMATGLNGHPRSDFAGAFPQTLNPGSQVSYRLTPYNDYATTQQYSGFFTYRADTLHGSEYLSLMLYGSHCTGVCLPRDGPPLSISAYDGSTAPRHDIYYNWDFGPKPTTPEIVWTSSGTTDVFPCFLCSPHTADFDYTFEVQGTYNIDASKVPTNQSGALADVLNGLCANGAQASCKFTPTSPLTFGTGPLTEYFSEPNCSVNAPGGEPLPAAAREVAVTQERDASLSVGGTGSVGLEASVFNVIEAAVSVKFGVEHEWTDDTEFKKTVTIYVPSGWVGVVWVAPEVGKVTGTMVMTTSKASYTFTNLTEVKSGVQPDLLTPPYDLVFDARAMTDQERQKVCPPVSKPAPPGGLG